MKRIFLVVFLSLIITVPLSAETVDISSSVKIHFDVPSGWVSSPEPPDFLINEMAEHIEHDALAKGHHPSPEQLQQAARKRFEENEVLLYNPQTYSFLSIDFSSLRQGEKPPSHNSIKLSTRYAGESLSNEEGVTDFSSDSSSINIRGAWYAHRLDSRYKHHDKPMAFIGVVGFTSPYWFYFYYTDYLGNESDRKDAEKILQTIRIENR